MAEDSNVTKEYKALILSLSIESNDINIIKEELQINSVDIISLFIYLTQFITDQISLISLNNQETIYFTKLIQLFKLIRADFNDKTHLLPKNDCIKLIGDAIEKLNYFTIQDENTFNFTIIQSLIDLTKELLIIYPKEVSSTIGDIILFHSLLSTFSQYNIIRFFIYQIVPFKRDFFSTLQANIGVIFSQIAKELPKATDSNILNELLIIAEIFVGEFKGIYNDFYLIINQLIYCNDIHEDNQTFKKFFKSLFALVFKNNNAYCFEIIDLMLQLYDEHFNEQGISRLILLSLFSSLGLSQYFLISDNSDFISKFISQLYKSNDLMIIEFYFKWLDMKTRTEPEGNSNDSHSYISFGVNDVNDNNVEILMPQQNTLSREFKAFSKTIPLFAPDSMLSVILNQLKRLFEFRQSFLIEFLDQIELYQSINLLINKKSSNGEMLFVFIKDLLKIYSNESIFTKITQSNLLNFDLCIKDSLVYDKIHMSLIYESNQDKFNTKCDKILEKLGDLSFEIQNRRDCFTENVNKFIDVFNMLLQSFLQEKNRKISPITIKLFKDLTDLLIEFSIVLFEYEVELMFVFKLWNNIFDFIYNFNLILFKNKFKEDNIRSSNMSVSFEEPSIISKDHIQQFIYEGLSNCNKANSIMLLRYLYDKCLNYKSTEFSFEYPEIMLDALQLIKFKYVIPKIFSQSKERRFSILFLESQMLLKCIIKVIFAMDITENTFSLLEFMDFVLEINYINSSILLHCGIVKSFLKQLGISDEINKKIYPLFEKLMKNFTKKDMEIYLKQVYVLLIKQSNYTIGLNLLKIIYDNIDKSAMNRNTITLTPINSNNPQVYHMLYMHNAVKNNNINMLISLYTHSFQSLTKFYLCNLSNNSFHFSIVFENDNINCYLNEKLKHSFMSFTQELNKNYKGAQSQMTKIAKWLNFIIEKGSKFNLQIEKSVINISIPDIIFNDNLPSSDLSLSLGFINNKPDEGESLSFCELISHVDISYLLLTKEIIPLSLVQEINDKQINYSKGKSVTQVKLFEKKDGLSNAKTDANKIVIIDSKPNSLSYKDILTEILFNKINLENVQNMRMNIDKQHQLSQINNNDNKDYIPYIPCNNGIKKNNRLFLIKSNSVIEFASMNAIYNISSLTKKNIERKLYSFYDNLDMTLSNVFFADLFYTYLIEMNSQLFIMVYQTILNIILKVANLRKFFFYKYINTLPFIFINNVSNLDKEFATCLLMNPEIPLSTIFVGQCLETIYLNPHLFPLLSKDIQMVFFEKFYIYFHSSDITNSSIENTLFFRLIKKLVNLLLHTELNKDIAEIIKEKIEEIINIFFNDEKAKVNEFEMLSSQCCHYLAVISSYSRYKEKGIDIYTPDLEFLNSKQLTDQIQIIFPLLNDYCNEQSDTSIISEDDEFLIDHFKLEFVSFKESLQYTHLIEKSKKILRLVWPELFDDYDDYFWGLSTKEGYCRMRKKLVLKENDMKITEDILSNKIFSYEKYWIWLEKMALYELYSSSSLIKHIVNSNDRYQNSYMCLLIKNNIKTESLLILGEKVLYIITNVIIDSKKKFHLSKVKTSNIFWARNDNEKEWERIISTDKKKRDTVNQFDYNSTQIKLKTISYLKISEMHKKMHLHQKNSIEIFTLSGSSYFITVFPKYRNEIFIKILKNIDDQSENSNIKNIQKASGSNVIYLKHYPLLTIRSKRRKKPDVQREKTVIENKAFANDLQDKWSQYYLMSNFNYLMTINTLAGRGYNDLTQYFIFPWMLKDFSTDKMDPSNDNFYRDFSFPLHAQTKNERDNLKKKYNIKIADDKNEREKYEKSILSKREKTGKNEKYINFPIFHSGNFYSNFTFVCYYMFRINPFTSIAFSVKGTFDQGDRCFNCLSFFATMKTKYQEWVPELFYFPELLVNINNQHLGIMIANNEKKNVNDVSIPPWADMDPRTVSIIFNKILEGPKVSGMLNNWIDLVFGYKLTGKDCIDAFNLFGEACYPYEDLKKKKYRNKELCLLLNETENMGCCPIQIFNKPHIQKKISTNVELYSSFYEKKTYITLVTTKSNEIKCDISSKSIGDFKAKYEWPRYNTSNGEGGLSSLHQYIDRTNHDDLDEEAKQKRTYYAVGKNKSLIGPKFNLILSYSQTSLYITMPKYSIVFEYNLNEASSIDKAISSINGKFIIAGLSNGTIIKYKKKKMHKETIPFPPIEYFKQNPIKKIFDNSLKDKYYSKSIHPKYVFYDKTFDKDFDFWLSVTSTIKTKQILKKQLKKYFLLEETRSGIPLDSISQMVLCESYSFLLVIDQSNYIYHYDFNQMKLVYKFRLKSNEKKNYPIKYAKIIYKTGDYVVGNKYSIHLFTINGLPLAEMNIFDILRPCQPITAIDAVAVNDTIVFTGHSNGEVNIWRLKTDSYVPTSSETDFPLFRTFHQRYQNSFKEKTYSFSIQKRELDDLKTIRESKSKIIMIKLTDEGNRLYFIDQDKKIFRMSNEDYSKTKSVKPKSTNTIIQYNSKMMCKQCKKVCDETCSSINSSGLCAECWHSNSNSSLSDRLIFDF